MANRTVADAKSIRGTNPQYLVEKITRTRIYECKYWKEECFALSGIYNKFIFNFLSPSTRQVYISDPVLLFLQKRK